ncbi:hypothetical protein HN018_07020 [Lichenicola cladoniae]|uniref:Lipoprotein n=1 Tax=Lichenicola cladoniae TaxID=1484109 RepID=A0A6M8HNC1_9PROT|nr:hypothetical protein [Lichenicola cladoniae]NPD67325.1 hypothetical protein [Acetobacteraceae bacterium]QKE89826.1 hypothetical protein HN018_07020 [Lichenicola cladoniae]
MTYRYSPKGINMFRTLAILIGCVALSGCAQTLAMTNAANADLANVEVQAAKLIAYYPVAKGLVVAGEVSLTLAGQPAAAAALEAGVTKVDAVVAQLQAAEDATNADAAAISALIVQVTAQTQTLVLQVAPVVKVVPTSATVLSATSVPAG